MSRPATPPSHDRYLARRYFPELDGVRALCVLLVVTVHLYDARERWAWLAGSRGVTVFFILSGFLITTLGLREEAARGGVSLAAFYVRRCCRLLPAYYLTLAAYGVCLFVLGVGAPSLRDTFAEALPYYLGYLQEVPFYTILVAGRRDLPFFHSWSLGVEEKFYLVWPVVAFLAWRGRPRRLAGSLALAAAFAAAPFVLAPWGPEARLLGRCLFSYFHLLVGCVAALLLHDRRCFDRLRPLRAGVGPALAAGAFLAVHFATPWVAEPSAAANALHVAYSLSAAAVLAALVGGEGRLPRALGWAPLAFVGRLSYGIYLIHVLAIVAAYRVVPAGGGLAGSVAAYAAACGLSVAGAWLLAVAVERPGIEAGRRWSRLLLDRPAAAAPGAAYPAHP